MSDTKLPESVLNIINAAVSQAVQQTREVMESKQKPTGTTRDYYRIMEQLLFSYPALKQLVEDRDGYVGTPLAERSKSIIKQGVQTSMRSREDVQEEYERDRENAYNQTLNDFLRLERTVQLHKMRKEFVVVRMYYFNEEWDGTARKDGERNTFLDIAVDTGHNEKTLRNWRNRIVNDMAVCMFGIEAAVAYGTFRE